MQEKQRPRPAESGGPSGLGDPFAPDNGNQNENATVSHGVFAEQLPVAGMTVGEIRARYRDRFDIDPGSISVIDGNAVDETTAVRPGQILSFLRRSGEKGRARTNPRSQGTVPCAETRWFVCRRNAEARTMHIRAAAMTTTVALRWR